MTETDRFFISILSEHINRLETKEIPASVDLQALYGIAHSHNVGGIVYLQLRECDELDHEIKKLLQNDFHSAVSNNVIQSVDFQELKSEFSENKIDILRIKGNEIGRYYPVPELRVSTDTDTVIHPSDEKAAYEIMSKLGYTEYIDNHGGTFTRFGAITELHSHMFYEEMDISPNIGEYFDSVWNHTSDGRIDISFHFIFLIAHMAKHIQNRGCGIIQFIDLAVLAKYGEIDFGFVKEQLETLNLLKFAEKCALLCEKWFGVNMPFDKLESDDTFISEATERILRSGAHGFSDEKNNIAWISNNIDSTDTHYLSSTAKLTVAKLFPNYKIMRKVPRYAFIDGKPILLPIAWIYRLGFTLVYRNESKKVLTDILANREEIEKRISYLKMFGLK